MVSTLLYAGCTTTNTSSGSGGTAGAALAERNGESLESESGSESTRTMRSTNPDRLVDVVEVDWQFGDVDGLVLRTPHYDIYTTISAEYILDRLPLFVERALAQYTSSLGELPAPPKAMTTYLFGTRNQWEAKTRQVLPNQATTYLSLGRGGFTTGGMSVLYYIGPRGFYRDTFAIAAHEGWHQYSQSTFRNPLPVWLEEGIATYMEGFVSQRPTGFEFRPWFNEERFDTLREAARRDRLIPLNALLDRSPQWFLERGKSRLLTYYAQVWALAHFLAEGEDGRYRPALQQLLSDAIDGRVASRLLTSKHFDSRRERRIAATSRTGAWVVAEYFNPNVAEFQAEYDAFVRQIVRPGMKNRIVRGHSPAHD